MDAYHGERVCLRDHFDCEHIRRKFYKKDIDIIFILMYNVNMNLNLNLIVGFLKESMTFRKRRIIMKNTMSFEEFVASPSFKEFLADSKTARYIYENIICTEEMVRKMAEMSDRGKPAIMASGPVVEHYYSVHMEACDMDLTERQVRQVIGRMNAAALKALGYEPSRKGVRLKKGICAIFKSGTVFDRPEAR